MVMPNPNISDAQAKKIIVGMFEGEADLRETIRRDMLANAAKAMRVLILNGWSVDKSSDLIYSGHIDGKKLMSHVGIDDLKAEYERRYCRKRINPRGWRCDLHKGLAVQDGHTVCLN